MYYICIENNAISAVLNYEPSVPVTVEIVKITDQEYDSIIQKTHIFDVNLKRVIENKDYSVDKEQEDQRNAVEKEFLNSTDWMILRHIRQKYLKLPTSLTEEEYEDLEKKRNEAASRIIT